MSSPISTADSPSTTTDDDKNAEQEKTPPAQSLEQLLKSLKTKDTSKGKVNVSFFFFVQFNSSNQLHTYFIIIIIIIIIIINILNAVVIVRFAAIGNAPILKQSYYKITASNKFQTVIQFLRKELRYQGSDPLVSRGNGAGGWNRVNQV
jgi:hypothetical protein